MKKSIWVIAASGLLVIASCNNSGQESKEVIVKDSMGVTTGAPVTTPVDTAAADSVKAAALVQTTVENYVSAKGDAIKATYNNGDQVSLVALEMDGKDAIKLTQTQAWAKGAEYTNGKILWKVNGDNATLTIEGKQTKYTVKR